MSEKAKQDLLNYIAPCSLLCYTCPALKDGAISEYAIKLCKYFEGYYDFNDANMPDQYRWRLNEFEEFYKQLEKYTKRKCPGCRNNPSSGSGCIEGCFITSCVKEHGVDYCAACSEYPCEKAKTFFTTINKIIGQDWENGNKRIKEIGIEEYFNEKKNMSHYISYKK